MFKIGDVVNIDPKNDWRPFYTDKNFVIEGFVERDGEILFVIDSVIALSNNASKAYLDVWLAMNERKKLYKLKSHQDVILPEWLVLNVKATRQRKIKRCLRSM